MSQLVSRKSPFICKQITSFTVTPFENRLCLILVLLWKDIHVVMSLPCVIHPQCWQEYHSSLFLCLLAVCKVRRGWAMNCLPQPSTGQTRGGWSISPKWFSWQRTGMVTNSIALITLSTGDSFHLSKFFLVSTGQGLRESGNKNALVITPANVIGHCCCTSKLGPGPDLSLAANRLGACSRKQLRCSLGCPYLSSCVYQRIWRNHSFGGEVKYAYCSTFGSLILHFMRFEGKEREETVHLL